MYPFPAIVLGCNIGLHFHSFRLALVTEVDSRPPDDDMVGGENAWKLLLGMYAYPPFAAFPVHKQLIPEARMHAHLQKRKAETAHALRMQFRLV